MADTVMTGIEKNRLLSELKPYGFVEISDLIVFTTFHFSHNPDIIAHSYIKDRIDECLSVHDNGGDYFRPLRQLSSALNEAINAMAGKK